MKILANKLSDNALNTILIVHPTKDSNTFWKPTQDNKVTSSTTVYYFLIIK